MIYHHQVSGANTFEVEEAENHNQEKGEQESPECGLAVSRQHFEVGDSQSQHG